MNGMATVSEPKNPGDEIRAHLERSRELREQMIRYGNGVVEHLRRAAALRREAARGRR
jgi:hypothetical protein